MSFLAKVTRGKLKKPYLIMVYGADGVGKSTFASQAPEAIFIGPEAGTDQLDVARLPRPQTWSEVTGQVNELIKAEHGFQTLVIDTVDWLEQLLWGDIAKRYGKKTIDEAAGGYGKGYGEALREWVLFKDQLNVLRETRGMNIIVLGHSEAVEFIDPMIQSSYIRFQLKLHKKAGALFREWVDAVLFVNFETYESNNKGDGKTRAMTDGVRVMSTERRAGWDAKNRFGLPLKLEFSWPAFVDAATRGIPDSPKAVRARIDGLLTAVRSPELKEKVIGFLDQTAEDDVRSLLAIEQRLAIRVSEEERETV